MEVSNPVLYKWRAITGNLAGLNFIVEFFQKDGEQRRKEKNRLLNEHKPRKADHDDPTVDFKNRD